MGQILSSPITTKHSTEGKNERFSFGASSMQGWRITMEDAHTHILDYDKTGTSFFGVFDGHGGQNVAKYSSQQIASAVINSDDFKKGDYKTALKKGFFKIDSDLLADPQYENETSGCTAIVALITSDNDLYVSNAGDSRAIISTDGIATALSEDHKPGNPIELERIQKAGGYVEFGRVNGNLALSRALGDFDFKKANDLPPEKQAVTADPDISIRKITEKDEFIVLACDGIWDCMSNQEVVTFVRKEVANNVPLKEICEKLMDHCLSDGVGNAGVGCDNMTVEIVAILNGKTEEGWYSKIRASLPDSIQPTVSTEAAPLSSVKTESLKQTAPIENTGTKPVTNLTSESRQYDINELKNSPDITSSILKTENNKEINKEASTSK